MELFDLFKKKQTKDKSTATPKLNTPEEIVVEKINIITPKPSEPISYEGELENIRAYFGKLYKVQRKDLPTIPYI